jgi:hypothetical protein
LNTVKRRFFLVVTSDPRSSPKPAEAIRIAAGLASWRRLDLRVYLAGPAVLVLSEETDDLVDGSHLVRYPRLLEEAGSPVYVDEESGFLGAIGRPRLACERISLARLADLSAEADYLMRM